MSNKLILLAGGISSRMKNSSAENLNQEELQQANRLPKGMIGIGKNNRPFLDYLLYNAHRAGIDEVAIVVNDRDQSIREYYQPRSETDQVWNLKMHFAIQRIPEGNLKPLGTADALQQALEQLPQWKNSPFIICNSDNLYSVNVLQLLLLDSHANALPGYDRNALQFEEARIRQFALLNTDEENFLIDIIEKPTQEQEEEILQRWGKLAVSMNIFKFDYNTVLLFLRNTPINPLRNEKELPTTLRMVAQQQPKSVFVIPVSETVPDLTSKGDIQTVRKFLEENYPEI